MDHSQDSSPLTRFKDQDRYARLQLTICTALARTGEFALAEDNLALLTADRKSGCEQLYHYNCIFIYYCYPKACQIYNNFAKY